MLSTDVTQVTLTRKTTAQVVESSVNVNNIRLGHLALLVVDFSKFVVLSFYLFIHIFLFSIYTLSDVGELSNLIGSLSRTIEQYSPPSEWIICELDFFPIFYRERSFKSRQNPKVDFFSGKKRLRRIQNGFFPFTVVEFCGRWIVYNSRLFA